MKYLILILLILITAVSCEKQKRSPVEGAWRWVSIQYFTGDTLKWERSEADLRENGIKMWSKGYFVFVRRSETDTTFSYGYGGGTYTLEGKKYEETVLYHDVIDYPDKIGLKEMMLLEIRNDTLIQTYPVDENGKLLSHYTYVEKMVRLN